MSTTRESIIEFYEEQLCRAIDLYEEANANKDYELRALAYAQMVKFGKVLESVKF